MLENKSRTKHEYLQDIAESQELSTILLQLGMADAADKGELAFALHQRYGHGNITTMWRALKQASTYKDIRGGASDLIKYMQGLVQILGTGEAILPKSIAAQKAESVAQSFKQFEKALKEGEVRRIAGPGVSRQLPSSSSRRLASFLRKDN